MPGNVRTMRSICARGKQLPVGLFGEQSSSSRVSPSVAASSCPLVEREVGLERNLAHRHVVDRGGHLVHAVSRRDRHGVVQSRLAENAECEIDRLVRSVADEYFLRGDALDFRQAPLEFALPRIGITVAAVVVGVLVRVEEDAEFGPDTRRGPSSRGPASGCSGDRVRVCPYRSS